jgi:hypothetical protein
VLVMGVGLVGYDFLLIGCRVASSAGSWPARSSGRSKPRVVSMVFSVSSDGGVAAHAQTRDAFGIAGHYRQMNDHVAGARPRLRSSESSP